MGPEIIDCPGAIALGRPAIRPKSLAPEESDYRRKEFEDLDKLADRMRRDITEAMRDRLGYFQSFDDVKVYYDNCQDIVKRALDKAIGQVLSKGVVQRRKTSMTDYRLEQVADYLCTTELALIKYQAKEAGGTYNKFFGGIGAFKKNWLKQARRKRRKLNLPHKTPIGETRRHLANKNGDGGSFPRATQVAGSWVALLPAVLPGTERALLE